MEDNRISGERPAGQEAAQTPRRYVDMMSDAGFKAVFGDHGNKAVLIDLLNVLLPPHRHVQDITYSTTEIPGLTPTTRGVRFDLRCTGDDGSTFIVELQRGTTDYFFRRSVSYTSKVYDSATLPGKRKFGDGIEEGRATEKVEIARNLKAMGLDEAAIMKATGLTEEQVAKL